MHAFSTFHTTTTRLANRSGKRLAPNRKVSRESQQKVSYLDAMEILVIKGLSPAQFS